MKWYPHIFTAEKVIIIIIIIILNNKKLVTAMAEQLESKTHNYINITSSFF